MTDPRTATQPTSARLTASTRAAIAKHARKLGIRPADAQRVLVVERLRELGYSAQDLRVDRVLEEQER